MKTITYLLMAITMVACKPRSAEISNIPGETIDTIPTPSTILKDTVAVTLIDTIAVANKPESDIFELKKLNGSTLRDDFLGNLIIKQRLQKLLGKERFSFMIDHWNLGAPIELEDNILVAKGCMSHYCPETNFIVIIDIAKNTFHVGIRDNDLIKTYTENESNKTKWVKDRLQQWEDTYGG